MEVTGRRERRSQQLPVTFCATSNWFFFQKLRRDIILQHVIEGKLERRVKDTGRRERRSQQLPVALEKL